MGLAPLQRPTTKAAPATLRRINCVRASDRRGIQFPDEHSLRAWLCTRCVVTFQLAAIACGVDALALTHVVARTALVHRTRVFPFRADPAHDDGAFVHAHLCLPLRDAIYALDAAVKREIHAAAELLRHSTISAHANRLHSQDLTWLQASDIANADLYAEGASRRAIGAIHARPRDASAREVNLGRLVNTREAGAHALPVALAEVIQATAGYDLLDSAPGLGLRGTGFAEICAAAARVVPGDDGIDLWPSSSAFEDVAFQRGYYGDEPIQLDALRFLIASAAAFGALLVYLSDAHPPGRERRGVLDGLPCTADVQSEAAACAASKRLWCSWVLFSLDEESSSGWSEVECGGMGFGHNKLRRRIAKLATDTADLPEMVKEEEPADNVAAELRERAEAVDDAALAEPLRSAICSMESALATVGSAVKKCKCAAPPAPAVPGARAAHTDSSVRALLGAAIAQPTDEEAVCELIALMQGGLDGAAGADELVDVLVRSFEAAPPTDAEMVALRRLQERWSDRGGLESYAVATAWLAALFVRTERCIAARSRLDECVRAMNAKQRSELQRLGERLVSTELPELLQSLADVATFVQKIEQSIDFQEVSVRSAKGVSAGLSLTGTAMAFTPLCAVGFGLLAAGAGVGVTTATGDALGQHVQKEELRRRLALLGVAEEKVQHQLRALLAFSFPGVQPEEFVEASAPLRFGAVLPEMLVGSAVVHAGGAAARVAPGLLSRVGLTVASRSLSVLGAVVSTGDFVHSVVTSNPNREILGKVHAYLEGEAETSRAWWVLLCHWLGQAPRQRASTPGGEEPDGATVGGDASQEPAGDRGDDHALQQAQLQSSMMSAMESRLSKDLASACSEPCGDPAAAR